MGKKRFDITKNLDVIVAIGVILIVLMIIIPLNTMMLDF
jgi:flagellar biosynthesis component FlhA